MPKSATPRQSPAAAARTGRATRAKAPGAPPGPPRSRRSGRFHRGGPRRGGSDPRAPRRPRFHDVAGARPHGDRGVHAQKRQLTIAQISQRTGIPRAAVRRCLYTLGQLGYVGSDDRRTFALRPKILELGHAYMSSSPLASSSQPVLDRVSDVIHESCSMAILDGDEILYIARSSTQDRIMSIDLGLGSRLPAHCTSMGRVLLAGLPPDELEAYPRPRSDDRVHEPHDHLAAEARGLRWRRCARDGYALVDQELEIGLRSLAVPVQDRHGRVAAAMNVGVQASRVTAADLESRILPELLTAGRELGMLLAV